MTEAEDDGHGSAPADGDEDEKATAAAGSSGDSSDTPARVLGGLALVLAIVGTGIAVVTGRRRSA